MTAVSEKSYYEKQLLRKKKQIIANSRCRICGEPIGNKSYITFEERYFHVPCVKQNSPATQ
ncbi:MAG: hypothetical protein ACOX0E_00600 [Syntrophomonadaceae bacterium]|jgi:formylmethanofuran dehydrogenase subunit E